MSPIEFVILIGLAGLAAATAAAGARPEPKRMPVRAERPRGGRPRQDRTRGPY